MYNLASGAFHYDPHLGRDACGACSEATYAWDVDKPLGQLRRAYDISRLSDLGFVARTELRDGLSETLNWYLDNLGHVRS